ncbi:MAG: hypothetical protein ACT4OS_09650 [Acidimicrobiales bacterium]
MAFDPESVRARLGELADELAEAAIDMLSQAVSAERPDPGLLAEERRLTRARRAIEKAASLLSDGPEHDS